MARLRLSISMSLDGFIAGSDQSPENPLGVGGMDLHQWAFPLKAWRSRQGLEGGEVNESSRVVEAMLDGVGAWIMGRNMFGGHPGAWRSPPWTGWWGDNPPFRCPVFVVTHHPRPPLALRGGTTFTFVTDGIASALEQARQGARGRDILLGGGANAARQFLAAGLVDEMTISMVPVLLGRGERLFEDLGAGVGELRHIETIAAPGVVHWRFAR